MRRPLVIVAILYTAGLLLAEETVSPLPWLLGIGLALAIAALFLQRFRRWLLPPLVVLAGWANLTAQRDIVSPHDLRLLLTETPAETSARGILVETPSVRLYVRDEVESFRTLAVVKVESVRVGAKWVPATGRLLTLTPGSLAGTAYAGTQVEVEGVVRSPPEAVAPGLFDYRSYLARQGIYFQLKVASTNAWKTLAAPQAPMGDRFLAWAKRTLSRGLPEEDEPLRLLFAMTLGWRADLSGEVYEPFMESGTMHIFAISGLHIALIAGLLVAVLRLMQLPRAWCGLVVIPLIWFYTGATGWQSSAIRSSLMMSIVIGGWSLGRPSDLLNSLSAAALIILVWQPQQLFQASFQLSFFVVLSIALLTPPLQRYFDKLLAHDPFLPREVLPRWRRWLETPLRWLAMSFATSLAAWLGALLLTAHYFHIFSPVTLLANLLIVPVSGAALAANLGSLLCGDWLPWPGELLNHSAWFCMSAMVAISHWATRLPGAFCYVASPPGWLFVVYYGLLIASLSGWIFRRDNRCWLCASVILLLVGLGWEWWQARREVIVTVLPLNGGHAVHMDAPGAAQDWLVDCGNSNAVQFVTLPFLRGQGVNRLAHLALTHGDLQHVGGTRLLWNKMPVLTTVLSPARFRSTAYREVVAALEVGPAHRITLAAGNQLGSWMVLHPASSDRYSQADDASLVQLAEIQGTRILLLGDLGRTGQEALLRRIADLRADIVISGLPEQGEALCDGLLAAIRPQLIVVADSEFPATKRATPGLRQRLAAQRVPVLYTRESGAIRFNFVPGSWTVQTMNRPAGQNDNHAAHTGVEIPGDASDRQ
jgi:competence protein ComEC